MPPGSDTCDTAQVRHVWNKLAGYYGSRLAREYGEEAPEDWCQAINAVRDKATLDNALAAIKRDHGIHPPTLPQFEAALNAARPRPQHLNIAERLTAFVLKNHELTEAQMVAKWDWLSRTREVPGDKHPAVEITGVVVPGDPSIRVMLEDMR